MKLIFISLLAMAVTSCVTTPKVVRVTPENEKTIEGVRFFMPKAYLLVAEKDILVDGAEKKTVGKDGKTTLIETQKMALAEKELVSSIIYLPNPQEEYAISITEKAQLNIIDGWRLEGINRQELKTNKQVLEVLTGMKDLEAGFYEIIHNEAGSISSLKKIEIIK